MTIDDILENNIARNFINNNDPNAFLNGEITCFNDFIMYFMSLVEVYQTIETEDSEYLPPPPPLDYENHDDAEDENHAEDADAEDDNHSDPEYLPSDTEDENHADDEHHVDAEDENHSDAEDENHSDAEDENHADDDNHAEDYNYYNDGGDDNYGVYSGTDEISETSSESGAD